MLALYLQFSVILLAVSIQPFVIPVYLSSILGGIEWVFLYATLWPLAVILFLKPAFNFAASRRRFRLAMTSGLFLLAGYDFALTQLGPSTTWLFPVLIVIFGLHCAFFWLPRHVLLSYNISVHTVGAQSSILQLISLGTGFMGPIIAGTLAEKVSFQGSFYLAATLAALSALPLLHKSLVIPEEDMRLGPMRELLKLPLAKTVHRVHFFEGVTENCFALCWVFAFVQTVGGISSFGLVAGVSALIAGLVSRWTGTKFDQSGRVWLLAKSTALRSIAILLYCLVPFAPSVLTALLIDTLYRLIESAHATVRTSYIFGLANRLSPAAFQFNRELALNAGRAVSGAVLMLCFHFFGSMILWPAILVGAISQGAWIFLRELDGALPSRPLAPTA